MDDKLKSKLEKLLALSQRGAGGEKETAKKFLDSLLKKNGLTLKDFEEEKESRFYFKYQTKMECDLLGQIIGSVCDDIKKSIYRPYRKKMLGSDLTIEQFVEVELQYDVYKKDLKDQLKTFFHAFIMKNKIYPPTPSNNDREYSSEEIAQHFKAKSMAGGIEKSSVRKRIG